MPLDTRQGSASPRLRATLATLAALAALAPTRTAHADDTAPSWLPAAAPPPRPGLRPLRVAGALAFGAAYLGAGFVGFGSYAADLPACLFGVEGRDKALTVLMVPVAGPFLYAARGGRDSLWSVQGTAADRSWAVANGVVQVAGLLLFVIDATRATSTTPGPARAFALAPSPLPGGAGLTMSWAR